MPSTPTVSRWPQNMSVGPGCLPSSTPTTLGRPGSISCSSTSSPQLRIDAATAAATWPSPAPPGTSEGLTESIETSSRRSAMHGSTTMAGLYYALVDPKGKAAAITGASSGIGLAIARGLAAAGTSVVLGARRADRLQQAVAGIRAHGGSAETVPLDVTSEADVQQLVDRAMAAFGRLDVMVCNAGFGYYGT